MKAKLLLATALALPLLGAAPAGPNWVGMVAQGPNGAYVMGNPKAKVRLVEYISYTCGHCAHFTEEAKLPLKRDYVAKGLVAVEFRNAVRDQFDMTAALAARCGGAAKFFGNSEALMAAQEQWLGKAQGFIDANGPRLQKMAPSEGFKAIARGVGIDAIMRARGVTAVQLDACLINKPNQDRIIALTNEAWQQSKINGTPAFKVNGTLLGGSGTWAVVEPAIKAALGVG
jgi:protein-disulfide isomerase